jgi:hypothetical protein
MFTALSSGKSTATTILTLVPFAKVTTNEIVCFIYYSAQGTKVSTFVALLTLVP